MLALHILHCHLSSIQLLCSSDKYYMSSRCTYQVAFGVVCPHTTSSCDQGHDSHHHDMMQCCATRRRDAAPPSQNFDWLSLALRTHTLDRAHSSASNKIHQKYSHDATRCHVDAMWRNAPSHTHIIGPRIQQCIKQDSSKITPMQHEKSNHNSTPYPLLVPPQHKKVITTLHPIPHWRPSAENKKRKLSCRRPIIDSQLMVVVGESNNQLFRFLFWQCFENGEMLAPRLVLVSIGVVVCVRNTGIVSCFHSCASHQAYHYGSFCPN